MLNRVIEYTLLGILIWAITIWIVTAGKFSYFLASQNPAPRYHQHECFIQTDGEAWQPSIVWKVEQVGKAHYLVRQIPANVYRSTDGFTMPFSIDLVSEPTRCPL